MLRYTLILVTGFVLLSAAFAKLQPLFISMQLRAAKVEQQEKLQHFLADASTQSDTINTALAQALSEIPTAARIRVSIISVAVSGKMTFNTPYGIAAKNGTLPVLASDRPISMKFAYLNDLLEDRCKMVLFDTMDTEIRAQSISHPYAFLVCPLRDGERLIGDVKVSFDSEADLPPPNDLRRVERATRALSTKVSKALN